MIFTKISLYELAILKGIKSLEIKKCDNCLIYNIEMIDIFKKFNIKEYEIEKIKKIAKINQIKNIIREQLEKNLYINSYLKVKEIKDFIDVLNKAKEREKTRNIENRPK